MASSNQAHEGIIAHGAKRLINAIYWVSPYRWIDEYCKRREPADRDSADWRRIRRLRYFISESYILGWLVAGVLAAFFARPLPAWLVLLVLLRVAGILNKELGVLLFGICKITEGRVISTPPRIVILALINYATLSFLFAFAYQKIGPSALPTDQALIQAFSVSLTIGPAFTPASDCQWFTMLLQGAICFLFLGLAISQFVSLLQLEAVSALVSREKPNSGPAPPPDSASESQTGSWPP